MNIWEESTKNTAFPAALFLADQKTKPPFARISGEWRFGLLALFYFRAAASSFQNLWFYLSAFFKHIPYFSCKMSNFSSAIFPPA